MLYPDLVRVHPDRPAAAQACASASRSRTLVFITVPPVTSRVVSLTGFRCSYSGCRFVEGRGEGGGSRSCDGGYLSLEAAVAFID